MDAHSTAAAENLTHRNGNKEVRMKNPNPKHMSYYIYVRFGSDSDG